MTKTNNLQIDKLNTITSLFEGNEIRSIWDIEKEEYYYSVVDVIGALTDSKRTRKYWHDLKTDLKKEGSQLSEKIGQLKLKSSDGKYYSTDVLDQNKKMAQIGGDVAKVARNDLKTKLGKTVISKDNSLPYKYVNNEKIENNIK